MANLGTFTVRNLPRGIRERIRALARKNNKTTAETLSYLVTREYDRGSADRPYSFADWRKFTFKGGDKHGSMRVDEVVYGIARPKTKKTR